MKNTLCYILIFLGSITGYAQTATYDKSTIITDCWTTNPVIATATQQNAIAVYENFVYLTYYNSDRYLCISRSNNYGIDGWKTIQFSHRYEQRNGVWDSHNTPNIAISPNDKRIHLSFDMHKHELRYMISEANTADITDDNFTASKFSTTRNYLESTQTMINDVTYPRFFLGDNTLFFMYRDGGSGNGDSYMVKYKDDGYWNTPFEIIDGNIGTHEGSTSRCAYFNDAQYHDGNIMLTWVWRETPDAATNHDLMFAYSSDDGLSWKNTNNADLTLPMNLNSTGINAATIPTGEGLINHNGCTVDGDGNVHVILRIDGSYKHYYKKGTEWYNSTIASFTGDRPKIYCDKITNTLYAVIRQGSTLRLYASSSNSGQWNEWHEINSISDSFSSTTNSIMHPDGKQLSTMAVSSDGRLQLIRWSLVPEEESSIGNKIADKHLDVFPNPTNGQFTLVLKEIKATQISIYDMIGKSVYKMSDVEPNSTLNINLASGLYMVKIIDINNNYCTRKLIVK